MNQADAVVLWEHDLAYRNPPFPFLTWDAGAIKRALVILGFDFTQPIYKISDMKGSRWLQ